MNLFELKKVYLSFCFATITTMVSGQCFLNDDALLAYYPFDNNANELSSNANDGIVNGAMLAEDRFGNPNGAYYFDGTNNYITANTLVYSGSSASMSVWIKPIEITRNRYYNITRQGPSPANMLLAFQERGSILSFGVNTSSGYSELDVPIVAADYTDGQWHCITAVYDGNQQRLYVDGVLIGSQAKTGIIRASSPPPFTIGSMNNTREYFYGWIDEIKFFDRALSPTEAMLICDDIPVDFVDLGIDLFICEGDVLRINAFIPNATYIWQDNSTLSYLEISQAGIYWVEVSLNGCAASDTIQIIERNCNNTDTIDNVVNTIALELPNIFTPNNDGANDRFTPIVIEGIVSMNTIIYNRWGMEVYRTNAPLIEWGGRDLSEGTYYWVIQYTDTNGEEETLNGYVALVR